MIKLNLCFSIILLYGVHAIQGLGNAPGKPSNLQISVQSARCVTLSWKKPIDGNEGIIGYQFRCTGDSGVKFTKYVESHKEVVCGYQPYTEVTCKVNAVNKLLTVGQEVKTASVRTECDAPAPPYNLTIAKADKYDYDGGFKSWKYNVSWEPPREVNCRRLSSYPASYQVGRRPSVFIDRNAAFFSVNAGENVTFFVKAINDINMKSRTALSAEIFAPAAAPSRPTSVTLNSVSSGCVKLKWEEPTFSNGKVERYEYRCSGRKAWMSTLNGEAKSANVCGYYKPYTQVECKVRAINAAKEPGDESTVLATSTLCDAPRAPENLTLSYDSQVKSATGRVEWEITATWQAPELNCESLSATEPYRYMVTGGISSSTALNNVTFKAEAGLFVKFSVQAINNANLSSLWASVTEKTPEAAPSRPTSLSLLTTSPECVILNWRKPLYSNGDITAYEYKCSEKEGWKQTDSSVFHRVRVCGYQPSSQVSCDVRAINHATDRGDIASTGAVFTFSRAMLPPTTTRHQRYTTRTPLTTNSLTRSVTTEQPTTVKSPFGLNKPCPDGNSTCSPNAYCVLEDKYRCLCKPGFVGDGQTCKDQDECATRQDNCDSNAACVNTLGSFKCVCKQGYKGNGRSCTDIDECKEQKDNCDSNALCINTPGSFQCKCKPSFSGNGITCEAGLSCARGLLTCSVHALCGFNTRNFKFYCQCKEGFTGDGQSCSDVDECKAKLGNCDSNAQCINTVGSFSCMCNKFYSGDGVTCADLRKPCPGNIKPCSENAHCVFDGKHRCQCKRGFTGDGITCTDIDECATGADNCDENAFCTNTVGSFTCTCKFNFAGDGVTCI